MTLAALGPVYTIPFSNERSTKSCQFGLLFTRKHFRNGHKMKTIWKNGMICKQHATFQCKRLKSERSRYGFKEKQSVSLSISNEIVPFSSVYTETFHAVFKACRFQNRLHLMLVTKTLYSKRRPNGMILYRFHLKTA